MIELIESPFQYEEKPQWVLDKQRQIRREKREKKLGRTVGSWGGRRKGAGRPKVKTFDALVGIVVTNVQKQILIDMGNGSLEAGVNALIKEYL